MRFFASTWLALGLAACASRPEAHERLAATLREDPTELLRSIGSAADHAAAAALADALLERLDTQAQHALFRFGLGHTDERVVFGAAILMRHESNPTFEELRPAARVAIARFGDPDCPLSDDEILAVLGSVDFEALLARLPLLDPELAKSLLAQAHRVIRAEHVPALCRFALASSPELGDVAIELACMVVLYSDRHLEHFVEMALARQGRRPEPSSSPLPPTLRAALHALADPKPLDVGGGYGSSFSTVCARWLSRSTLSEVDLDLIERLRRIPVICFAATRALAALHDARSAAMLRREIDEGSHLELTARYALACRGDEQALEDLLTAEDLSSLALGLDAASVSRRRDFAAELLDSEAIVALKRIQDLACIVRGYAHPECLEYDEAWLAELEPLAFAAAALDIAVLRALVAVVPACATARLAEKLLAAPAEQLFAPLPPELDPREEDEEIDLEDLGLAEFEGDLGSAGCWPFLEVTRPREFRSKLREGLASARPYVRDLCAVLLMRLRAVEVDVELLRWAQAREERGEDVPWFELAAIGGPSIGRAIDERLSEEQRSEDSRGLVLAGAVLRGMPLEVASAWQLDDREIAEARALLLERGAGAAWVASQEEDDWDAIEAFLWMDPDVQRFLAPQRAELAPELALELGAIAGDPESRRVVRELLRDGRYASHHVWGRARTAGRDLSQLDFWIEETGTNCCRYVDSAQQALEDLFGCEPESSMQQQPEPLSVRLRRQLLPRRDRLRWSRIANGYVVRGEDHGR
ncbi:MAG: hypothetical protein IPN34_19325 [Planctomycetes bacterium]|nr:hypothetical protein [Planctomycetota bacterium]